MKASKNKQGKTQKKAGLVKPINSPQKDNPKSKLDALLGEHTTPLIVAVLFIVTFIGFIVVVCVKNKLPDGFFVSMITLLSTLASFFVISNSKKNANQ